MSLANIKTVAFMGMECVLIDVQVHIGPGLPFFGIVGLPDKSIAEAKERIRAAFNTLGLSLPPKRITINMSPANLPKEGTHYDLPIAVGLLVAMGIISKDFVENMLIIGELSLNGEINSVPGVLVAAMFSTSLNTSLMCSYKAAQEARLAGQELEILGFDSLVDIISFAKGGAIRESPKTIYVENDFYEMDMQDVFGQESAKRALEIAAVFNMHILLIGPPGIGKSMLAKRLITILPPLTAQQSIEISMIYSIANRLKSGELTRKIPFRDPHHSASLAALIGGGARAMPGEISLAHNGVLFLDELAEYSNALEGLRQSMESNKVTISRAQHHITYPAKAQIVAAMNPCKCGFFGTQKQCKRIPYCSQEYKNKISGPIFDRFDLIVNMDQTDQYYNGNNRNTETSMAIKERVIAAKNLYEKNYEVEIDRLKIEEMNIDGDAFELLLQFSQKRALNQRSFHKIAKIAKVISLLDSNLIVQKKHILEAVIYRG